MLRTTFEHIFEKVEMSSSNHQKWIGILTKHYKESPSQEFLTLFVEFLQLTVRQPSENSSYTKRVLNFASRFCADITLKEQKEDESHDFLTGVIEQTLKWSCLESYDLRYNACYFTATVLQDISEDVQLEITLIDEIQKVMLERMQETRTPIRVAAMSALVRLQDPQDHNCPVINAYLQALCSGTAIVRKEATRRIAPNMTTISKIKDRIRDSDPTVRVVAFQRCGDIGPTNFRIAEKHMILLCGFRESNDIVKNTFFGYLLPKWLTAYNGDYLKFVAALKLVADEDDINNMIFIVTGLIREFYNKHPLPDLISVLPITDEKLVAVEDISYDVTLFWRVLVGLLRESNLDEHLNTILPEMTPFSHYIDKVIKVKSLERMDEWKLLEYQFDLMNLLEIADNYDFSDEVGRRTMYTLTCSLLEHHFNIKLMKKIVSIAHKCSSSIEFFTNDMCQIISDVREPVIEQSLSADQLRELGFKEAELRVKINILQEEQSEAVNQRDYIRVQVLDNELVNCKKRLENLRNHTHKCIQVGVTKSDTEILYHSLDILMSVLELPEVNKMTPSLTTCRDNFLVPLLVNQNDDVHWRVLKCLALFCTMDKTTAETYGKIICIPVATYRTVANDNVLSLVQSILAIPDLISLYGVAIISPPEEANNTTAYNQTKRRLYNTSSEEDVSNAKMTLTNIYEIFVDMLDDAREEIRHKAIVAVTALLRVCPMTPILFSRIFLKWYNPVTVRDDTRLQVCLGLFIDRFMKYKHSKEVVKEAIIPTFSQIANAPKTSPLVDIDVDNLLMFLAGFINIRLEKEDLRLFALDVCMKISDNTNDPIVSYLTKLLCQLDITVTNPDAITELIERAEMLLENLKERYPKRYIEKFVFKLRQILTKHTRKTSEIEIGSADKTTEQPPINVLQERAPDNANNVQKEPQQIKRRKHSNSTNCVVLLERLNLKENSNVTHLPPIVECSSEMMEIDDEERIETPTTDSSKSSRNMKWQMNNIVMSETSDSDFSNDKESLLRRSGRCRKKRIIYDA